MTLCGGEKTFLYLHISRFRRRIKTESNITPAASVEGSILLCSNYLATDVTMRAESSILELVETADGVAIAAPVR